MLKKITAYFLIISLLSVNFSRFFIFAGFELNRNYIAAKLCENRDKPWLHCNGKCYFMKKINQARESERNDERQSQKNLFQEASITNPSPIKFQNQLLRIINTPCRSGVLTQFNQTLFRPPQLG
jgi:hypothetical protein